MMFRRALKALYFEVLSASGLERLRLGRLRHPGTCLVLNFHRVTDAPDPFWPPLRPREFEELLVFLQKHFVISTIASPRSSDERAEVILSFDDGYYDFLDCVVPILKRHSAVANLNVIAECALTGRPHWNVQLYDFLRVAPRKVINNIELPGFETRLRDDTDREKVRYGLAISRFLKNRSFAERAPLLARVATVIEQYGAPHGTRMLTVSEIREVSAFCELGAHSFRHDSMGYESLEYFRADVTSCRDFFSSKLKVPMEIYAFPNGSYRPEQLSWLRATGVRFALLVDERVATRGVDAYPRVTMYGDTAAELRLRAVGIRNPF